MAGGRGHRPSSRVHGDIANGGKSAWNIVFAVVREIPVGRVMTYGQISGMLGHVLSPVAVGWALHTCPEDVPWHRVVNASGGCSTERIPDLPPGLQRRMLAAEGVEFRLDGTLDLAVYGWQPREAAGEGGGGGTS